VPCSSSSPRACTAPTAPHAFLRPTSPTGRDHTVGPVIPLALFSLNIPPRTGRPSRSPHPPREQMTRAATGELVPTRSKRRILPDLNRLYYLKRASWKSREEF
jgi:hypothetical protein